MSEIKWIYSENMVNTINRIGYPILVLAGVSGAGKTMLTYYLESKYKDTFTVIRNNVTRAKRKTDKPSHFQYLSDNEFNNLKENEKFFLARYEMFPFYGYLNEDLLRIMSSKKIPLFMFRESGLERISSLLNNIYVINICSDSRMIITNSRDENNHPTIDMINDNKNKIELICNKINSDKIIKIYNNYDSSFFNNQTLTDFIEKIKAEKDRLEQIGKLLNNPKQIKSNKT